MNLMHVFTTKCKGNKQNANLVTLQYREIQETNKIT